VTRAFHSSVAELMPHASAFVSDGLRRVDRSHS
jgi:hypothetical protein